MSEQRILHTDGDFFQCQNYVLQLMAEKKISIPAFVLYSFYKSTAGFSQICYSYEYISINSGISKGAIAKGIKQLEKAGLIEVTRYGANKTFDIKLVPGANIPRRELKSIERKGPLFDGESDPSENFTAQDQVKKGRKKKPALPTESMRYDVKKKYDKGADFDITAVSPEAAAFWNDFQEEWKRHAKADYYPKNDMYQIDEIKDFDEARRLLPVMWALDEVDKWTKDSDHTLSVFVHLLTRGKLQAHYPKTSFYYRDQQNK